MYISTIVPLYKGKKYINQIISQLEECQKQLPDGVNLELIFSNDDPQEVVELSSIQTNLDVVVLNTDVNCGIHGARVKGLKNAKGQYVLFLDQDDRIASNYFQSQLTKLGMADAIVCACIHDKRLCYNEFKPIKSVVLKDKMIGEQNYIVSPGQVLIRKDAIPEAWTKYVLKTNGADDWFLWILLFSQNKKIEINEEVLYEHVLEQNNASSNTWRMYNSIIEILQIVTKNNLLPQPEIEMLQHAIHNILRMYLNDLDKMKKQFQICNRWLEKIYEKQELWDRLFNQGIHSVAIYGCNGIARNLKSAMEAQGFKVSYYIDRNANYLNEDKPVYSLKDKLNPVDLIIVALVQDEENIQSELSRIGFSRVLTISEIMN